MSNKYAMLISAAAASGLYCLTPAPPLPKANKFKEDNTQGYKPGPGRIRHGSKASKRNSPKALASCKRVKKSR